jgi:Uma2 family endonuclease
MAVSASRPRKTIDDHLALPEDVRAELIDGELYVTPAPSPLHQFVVHELHGVLRAEVSRSGDGAVFGPPIDVLLPSGDLVEPDVLWIPRDRLRIIGKARIEGVPALVVEVVSPSRPERDRLVKRDVYARNGVPEYWIADPESKSVEVFRLLASAYAPAGYFTPGTVASSPSLPGLRAPIDDLFRVPWS